MSWTLADAEARAAEAPRSFFIPPAQLRTALKRGDVVKLIFRLERADGDLAEERMWVEVAETDPYAGVLMNAPRLQGVIEPGTRVPFGPEHVCGYEYAPGQLGYPADAECLVSHAIIRDDVPPQRLLLDGDRRWHALAGDDPPQHRWTLGYLTDRFPETEAALREGYTRHGLLRRHPRDVAWRREGDGYVRATP